MEFSISAKIKKKLKVIAYYQIVGGSIGFIVIAWTVITNQHFTESLIIILSLAIAIFGFSIFCGQKILKGNIIQALNLSAINQSLQLLNFSVFGYAFQYVSGLFVTIGFDYTNDFKFTLHFGISDFILGINSSSDLILLEINLVAGYILLLIKKLKKNIEVELALFDSILPYSDSGHVLPANENIQLEDNND